MSYLKKLLSLEERASAQVAINVCQDTGFKEVALDLEKPTYGFFTYIHKNRSFEGNEKSLPIWTKITEAREKHDVEPHYIPTLEKKVENWNATVDEQCQRLTEGFPHFIRQRVHTWMYRVALEYLSYSRQQESLFGVSRYSLMNFITLEDWTEACQIDEAKLANRMLKDEQLTVLQRYRIACVYCLHLDIPKFWKRLSEAEKQVMKSKDTTYSFQEKDKLVMLWSDYMDQYQDEMIFRVQQNTWLLAAQQATHYGNQAALVSCWRRLNVHIKQKEIIDLTLKSVYEWIKIRCSEDWFKDFLSNELLNGPYKYIERYNLPYDFSELMRFFLSEMNKEQQLVFFKQAFQDPLCCWILECFVDWLHQDDFLPTINHLWGIVPEIVYTHCFLTLETKYNAECIEKHSLPSFYLKQNHYYDYQSFLFKLWEETPENYKSHLFTKAIHGINEYRHIAASDGEAFLLHLLKRSSFDRKDEALFKQVCGDLLPHKMKNIMYSISGQNICLLLVRKEKWSTLNWLLDKCLPEKEIPTFKKTFIKSKRGREFCLSQLKLNQEKMLEDLIQWSFEFDTEKIRFKYRLGIF